MAKNYPAMVMRQIKQTLLVCVLAVLSVTVSAQNIQPFEARYTAYQFGKDLGEATLSLTSLGRDRYRLDYASDVSMFFLSDKRHEESLFSISDDKIIPYKYRYERTGFGSDDALQAQFDSQKQQIILGDGKTYPWNGQLDNQLYRLDVQRQLARGKQEMSYQMLNYRGELREYRLKVMGSEQLDLPYGMLEGIKVKIMRESKKRQTYAWFSPSLNYQLVRLQQFKDGEEQGEIRLSHYQSSHSSANQ